MSRKAQLRIWILIIAAIIMLGVAIYALREVQKLVLT